MNIWKKPVLIIALMASSPAMAKKSKACQGSLPGWRTTVELTTAEQRQAEENATAKKELRDPKVVTGDFATITTWRATIGSANTSYLTIVFALDGKAVKTVQGDDSIANTPLGSSSFRWWDHLWWNIEVASAPDQEWNEIHVVDGLLEHKCVAYKKGNEFFHEKVK